MLERRCAKVCDADSFRAFLLINMHPFFPLMAAAARRLLSTHFTSCSSAQLVNLRQNFGKTKNCLAFKRAKKLSYIRIDRDSGGTGADEEAALSLANVVIEDE